MLTAPANAHDLLHRDRRRRLEDLQVLPQQFRFAGTALALDFARFTHVSVVQAVSTTALSSNRWADLKRAAGRGISSARSESGEPLFYTSI